MLRQTTTVPACLMLLASILAVPKGTAAPLRQTSSGAEDDPCLPFNMPAADELFGSSKKVFAHYFYPFPLSVGNKPASDDYYNANYLNKKGESSKWSAQGGYLRQRPLPVGVGPGDKYQLLNMQREVRMAIARGITGFPFDVLSANGDAHLQMLLDAAQSVDPHFKILVMPDIAALKSNADAVAGSIAAAARSPAAYRLGDGRLVVSAFNASANSTDWWAGVIAQLKARGIDIAFVPTFLGWKGHAAAFAPLSYGLSDWGTATAAVSDAARGDAEAAHSQ